MISAEEFYGRCAYRNMTAKEYLHRRVARWYAIESIAGQAVCLPEPETRTTGGIVFGIINIGANSVDLQDADSTVLVAIAPDQTALVFGLPGGSWAWTIRQNFTSNATVRISTVSIVGGTGAATAHTRYNWVATTWSLGVSAPAAHVEGAFARVGGRANLVGNYAVDADSPRNHELDESGTWATRTSCTFSPGRTCAAGVRGAALFFGGALITNVGSYVHDAWTAKSGLPIARSRGTATGIGRKAFLFPGDPVDTPSIAYDQPADFFHTITAYSNPSRRSLASFAIEDRSFVIGGLRDSPNTHYAVVEEYNPVTDAWTARTALSLGVRYGGAGVAAQAQGAYFGGRDAADTAQAGAAAYVSDAWAALTALPGARAEIDNQGVSL